MGEYKTIREGLAFGLWSHAWDDAYSRARKWRPGGGLAGTRRDRDFRNEMPPSDPGGRNLPAAAKQAASDLEQLYVAANNMTLEAMFKDSGETDKGYFGELLALAALGKRVRGLTRSGATKGIKIPSFEVKFDGPDLTWEGSDERRNPDDDYDGIDDDAQNPTRSIPEVRKILASRKEKCHPTCRGWEVFETDTDRGDEIQVCDECMTELPKSKRLSDDDVAQLPEALLALEQHGQDVDDAEREDVEGKVRVISRGKIVPRTNPPGFPVKGDVVDHPTYGRARISALIKAGRRSRSPSRLDVELTTPSGTWQVPVEELQPPYGNGRLLPRANPRVVVRHGEVASYEAVDPRGMEGMEAFVKSSIEDPEAYHLVRLIGPSRRARRPGDWDFKWLAGMFRGKTDSTNKFFMKVLRRPR